MKQFKFLAKQGQHNRIARLLADNYGKPRMSRYDGPRGEGIMIVLNVGRSVSKKAIARLLHAEGIPGAPRQVNVPIVAGDKWDVISKIYYDDNASVKVGQKFRWVDEDGRFQGSCIVEYQHYGCGPECCGGQPQLVRRGWTL